jgi:hypothetical protein
MRYYLDTEFHEDGRTIDLISLGLVAEDGREFYACSLDAELHRCHARDTWLMDNVLTKLPPYSDPAWMHRTQIRDRLLDFMLHPLPYRPGEPTAQRDPIGGTSIAMWAYYADYDWVAFCQLFGRMIDLPPQLPKWCRDLKQLSVDVGSPKHPPKLKDGEHNALADARWNRDLHVILEKERTRRMQGVP